LVHGQVTIIFAVSVGLFVCLCRVFLSRLWSNFDQTWTYVGYIVERTNIKILSSHFFAISILNPNYDIINDVISSFAKVIIERCGFHHWATQRISCGEVLSIFLYLLSLPSYDVINDIIMSDADCTPGREPHSVAASVLLFQKFQ